MGSDSDDARLSQIDELVDRVGRQHRQLHDLADKLGHLNEEIRNAMAAALMRERGGQDSASGR